MGTYRLTTASLTIEHHNPLDKRIWVHVYTMTNPPIRYGSILISKHQDPLMMDLTMESWSESGDLQKLSQITLKIPFNSSPTIANSLKLKYSTPFTNQ